MHVYNLCSFKSEVSQLIRNKLMMLVEINTGRNSVGALLMDTSRYFDVLLTVHLSIFILVINQLDAQSFVLH